MQPLISVVKCFTDALTFPAFIDVDNLRERASDDIGRRDCILGDCIVALAQYSFMILLLDHVASLCLKATK